MTTKDARILVIGGAGFVGSHLVDQLLAEPVKEIIVLDNLVRGKKHNLINALNDPRVQLVEGSIMDLDLLKRLMQNTTYVFHLAALWLFECVHQPRSAVEVNIVGTYNVIETAHQAGVKKLIYSSSASVYGNALSTPMTEDHPFNNRTMYGATKIAGEQFLRVFYEQHKMSYVGLRYMNIYGPRMDYKGAYVSVVMKVLDRIDAGQPPVIFGDGLQAYDFVHVEDVARANVLALKSDSSDDFFNVGKGVKTTINELVGLLIELTGSRIKPEYRPNEQSFVTERLGSTEKAERLLGFRAAISLRDGLKSVIARRLRDRDRARPAAESNP
jgi:UDP-glucose 4-epimerase